MVESSRLHLAEILGPGERDTKQQPAWLATQQDGSKVMPTANSKGKSNRNKLA